MKRISYGDDHYVTTDAIAERVLEYGKLMAQAGTADSIQIVVVGDDGQARIVDLLLGPASHVSAISLDSPELPLDTRAVLSDLDRRIAAGRRERERRLAAADPVPSTIRTEPLGEIDSFPDDF